MVDRKYVFHLIKLEQERSQTSLVTGANSISFVNVATIFIKIFETNMQQHQRFYKGFTYSGATITDYSIALELEQVRQHIFDRKKLKKLFHVQK